MDAILQGYVNDFKSEYIFGNKTESEVFEHFSNYCIVKRESSSDFELDHINVGKEGNPGIDGIAILVNGANITSPEGIHFFLQKRLQLEVDIIITQSKIGSKFDSGDILKFLSSVKDFINLDESHFNFNNDVLIKKQIVAKIFENAISLRRSPNLRLFYVTTGRWESPQNTMQFINPEIKALEGSNAFSVVEFSGVDSEKLKIYYKEIKNKNEKEITFKDKITLPDIEGVSESYLGVIPSTEFLKLIENSDGKISKHIFYDNVRDFQGMNSVNQEIMQTISNSNQHSQFCIYNNGVTVVAKSLRVVSNKFILQNFQIVNGCQTSHILYQCKSQITENLYIPIKIIVTTDYETTNNIIKATNRQTEVKSEAFESLKPFHKMLEEFFEAQNKLSGYEIHYERRSKQFDDQGIHNDKIITMSRLINSYVSSVILEPHSTHKYYAELLEYYEDSMFVETHKPENYYLTSVILKRYEQFQKETNCFISDKRLKSHVLMAISIITRGKNKPKSDVSSKEFEEFRGVILDNEKFFKICRDAIASVEAIAAKFEHDHRNRHQTKQFTHELIESIVPAKNVYQSQRSDKKELSTVAFYNEERGFGFINRKPDNIFFHISSVPANFVDKMHDGVDVLYKAVTTRKGLEAKEIELA